MRKLRLELTDAHLQLLDSTIKPFVLGEAAGTLRLDGASSCTDDGGEANRPRHEKQPRTIHGCCVLKA
jgi:hypothetical protein